MLVLLEVILDHTVTGGARLMLMLMLMPSCYDAMKQCYTCLPVAQGPLCLAGPFLGWFGTQAPPAVIQAMIRWILTLSSVFAQAYVGGQ